TVTAGSTQMPQELKTLCRDQDALLREATRLSNQLTACLKEYYPVALELFSRLTLPVALAFLKTYPTLEAARKASPAELAAFLKAHRHPRAEAAAQRIYQKLHAPQLSALPAITRAKSRFMLALVAQLLPLLEAIRQYDEEITRLFSSHPDSAIFASLPGAGKRLAPRLLAGWGEDRGRYDNAAAVQALAGTSPVLYQSGKYRFARCRRACVKFLRRALHFFAYESVRLVSWARTYYVQKRAAGKSHQEAVRALANIWVRIIFAMWLKSETYNEAVFLAAKARHAPAA
ncbi:MAG: transposase, partial [Moorellales bacterium]